MRYQSLPSAVTAFEIGSDSSLSLRATVVAGEHWVCRPFGVGRCSGEARSNHRSHATVRRQVAMAAQHTPTYTFPMETTGLCGIASITSFSPGTLLPPSLWPYTAGKEAYSLAYPTPSGVQQLLLADVAPDRSLQNKIRLS